MRYCVISHNRPDNIKRMEDVSQADLHWYVGKGEKKKYKKAKGEVIESGGLVESRNRALEDSFEGQESCLMLDDDLQEIHWLDGGTTSHRTTVRKAVREMDSKLDLTGLRMAGVSPTTNNFFANHKIGLHHFCIASMILVRPCELRFDEDIRTKEDYDYTLQHVAKFGGVCRLNYIIPHFKHYTNKGGVVDYRTEELEQDSIRKLKQKWGKAIKDNPRRKNEILLHIR